MIRGNEFITIQKLLRAEDVAIILNISRSFAYKLMSTNKLSTVQIGRSKRVRISDLNTFMENNIDKEREGIENSRVLDV